MTEPPETPAPEPTATPAPGTRPRGARPPGRKEIPWRLVILGAIAIYAVLFVILNSRQVPVSFVFFTPHVSLVVALLLALLIGFVAGYLFDAARDKRRRTAASAPTATSSPPADGPPKT